MKCSADCVKYSKVADTHRDYMAMERATDKDPDPDWNQNVEDAIWERYFQSEDYISDDDKHDDDDDDDDKHDDNDHVSDDDDDNEMNDNDNSASASATKDKVKRKPRSSKRPALKQDYDKKTAEKADLYDTAVQELLDLKHKSIRACARYHGLNATTLGKLLKSGERFQGSGRRSEVGICMFLIG